MKLADDVASGKLKSDTVSNLTEAYGIDFVPQESPADKINRLHEKLANNLAVIGSDPETFLEAALSTFGKDQTP